MTKKEKILKLFNDAEWLPSGSGKRCKIIDGEEFYKIGLAATHEYGEKYNDLVYARRIFKKMGYMCNYGHAFYITEI
jgi:hypothetical protein